MGWRHPECGAPFPNLGCSSSSVFGFLPLHHDGRRYSKTFEKDLRLTLHPQVSAAPRLCALPTPCTSHAVRCSSRAPWGAQALYATIEKNRPAGCKGKLWSSAYVTSTMGPAIKLDIAALKE